MTKSGEIQRVQIDVQRIDPKDLLGKNICVYRNTPEGDVFLFGPLRLGSVSYVDVWSAVLLKGEGLRTYGRGDYSGEAEIRSGDLVIYQGRKYQV